MNSHSQKILNLDEEAPRILDRFEARLTKLRQEGQLLWTGILRDIFKESKEAREQRDRAIYEQTMLIEEDLSSGDSTRAFERLAAIKGILSVFLLTLASVAALQVEDDINFRSRTRGGVRVVNVRAKEAA
ncbi:MAG: hypothetical protein HRU10_09235 [Opitutales bacterium]|nr:hypothetical protein [Opitutales bacterium]